MRTDIKDKKLRLTEPKVIFNSASKIELDFYQVVDEDDGLPILTFSVNKGDKVTAKFVFRSLIAGQKVLKAFQITDTRLLHDFGAHTADVESFKP